MFRGFSYHFCQIWLPTEKNNCDHISCKALLDMENPGGDNKYLCPFPQKLLLMCPLLHLRRLIILGNYLLWIPVTVQGGGAEKEHACSRKLLVKQKLEFMFHRTWTDVMLPSTKMFWCWTDECWIDFMLFTGKPTAIDDWTSWPQNFTFMRCWMKWQSSKSWRVSHTEISTMLERLVGIMASISHKPYYVKLPIT